MICTAEEERRSRGEEGITIGMVNPCLMVKGEEEVILAGEMAEEEAGVILVGETEGTEQHDTFAIIKLT